MIKDEIDFSVEIESGYYPTTPHRLYKIFGEENFTFEKAHYESKVDWSGFYTQLTP